jgi:tetratricopeptide (TPR) repeat protein
MLAKINKLKNWQVAVVILVLGFAVFSTGLTNPFQGDDISQIVTNVPVHSISNIKLFFEGSTFYNGQGLVPLTGSYYRPIMTTVFSLIYTIFGAHSFYFHLFQLLLCIGSTFILYLFLKYSFKPALALMLALIFLVHPLDSQVVFYIPYMQDALFFFFGILALWLLLRFNSTKSLLLVAACLLLSQLSKETGVVFIVAAILYLLWWDRQRLLKFIGIMVIPVALYLALRVHAVGWFTIPNNAPIDNLSLAGRLLTAPSLPILYISKLIFPWKLASGYYWVYSTFSFRHVLIPILIDLAVVGIFIYFGLLVRKRLTKSLYFTYLFFSVWAFLGLLPYLQIIPLDMTACETWLYFSMVGVLGAVGVILQLFHVRLNWLLAVSIVLISVLGIRTALRGFDYRSDYTLARKDISASNDDYNAYNVIAENLINQGEFSEASAFAERSISIYLTYTNLNNLGVSLFNLGNYSGAYNAYNRVLKLKGGVNFNSVVENLGGLTIVYGNENADRKFLVNSLQEFPQDTNLWEYLAIFDDQHNDNADAKVAIEKAAAYGQVSYVIYDNIMNNNSFILNWGGSGKTIDIK